MIGAKYELAIGVRFRELKAKLSQETKEEDLSDTKLATAVLKADFITDLKPLPLKKKQSSENKGNAGTTDVTKSTASEEQTVKENESDAGAKTLDEGKNEDTENDTTDTTNEVADNTIEGKEEELDEAVTEDASVVEEEGEPDDDDVHPDDLEMEVLDDVEEEI